MRPQEKARRIRPLIEKAAVSLDDADALDGMEMFPAWGIGVEYAADQRVQYAGKLYRVVQAHTSQAGWEPPAVPALFTEVAKPGEIPVWVPPTGAHDAYSKGAMVYYPDQNGHIYRSLVDGNAYSPEAYPAGWELVE